MGACHFSKHIGNDESAEMITNNKSVETNIVNKTRNLLLLGASSSGKSTIMKQFKYLYIYNKTNYHHLKSRELVTGWIKQIHSIRWSNIPVEIIIICHNYYEKPYDIYEYPIGERCKFKEFIYIDLIEIFSSLANNCNKFGYQNDAINAVYINKLLHHDKKELLCHNGVLQKCLTAIWSDSGIKKTLSHRYDPYFGSILCNMSYFLENIQRIMNNDYVPTFTDILYTTAKTGGFTIENFIFEGRNGDKQKYELIDFGGVITERRKWIQRYNDVSCVIFCVSLLGYNEYLWEDNTVNVLEDTFDLLHKICCDESCVLLKRAKFIIALNKCDIFKEKIKNIPFKYKNEFGPSSDYNQIMKWMKHKITTFDLKRSFHFNVICAIDSDHVHQIMQHCHDMIDITL